MGGGGRGERRWWGFMYTQIFYGVCPGNTKCLNEPCWSFEKRGACGDGSPVEPYFHIRDSVTCFHTRL